MRPSPFRRFYPCLVLFAFACSGCWPLDNPIDPALCGEQSCAIKGTCTPRGGAAPGDSCRVCDPDFSRFAWAPAPGCMITLAGNGEKGVRNGPAETARFHYPASFAVAGPGQVFVLEGEKHIVRKVAHGVVTTFAGAGKEGSDNGPLLQARFSWPTGMAMGPLGTMVVADAGNSAVRWIRIDRVSLLAGGSWGDLDGPAATARFRNPTGVAVDAGGGVYIADSESHVIRRIKEGKVSTVAGKNPAGGTPIKGNTDGKNAAARFHAPEGLAMDSTGNLLIADTENCLVRKMLPDGTVVTLAGNRSGCLPSAQETCADGSALGNATLAYPMDLAAAGDGRVLVADESCNRIRVIHKGMVSTVAGGDDWGDADGPLGKARISGPTGVDVDSAGYIYVLDTGNHKIRVMRAK